MTGARLRAAALWVLALALAPAAAAQHGAPEEPAQPTRAGAALASDPPSEPALRFDPFAGSGAASARVAASAPGFVPELRATLVAGPQSSVNLGGVLLGLGESAHGFRLEEVRPFEAVFDRGGQRVVLSIADEEGSDP